jgi:hypothetical protein
MSLKNILVGKTQYVKYLIEIGDDLTETIFELRIFDFNTMLNHNLI